MELANGCAQNVRHDGTGGQTMKFNEWFNTKLITGNFPSVPLEDLVNYEYVVNVSDRINHNIVNKLIEFACFCYWFPMNEVKRDIGLNSIYGALVILHKAEKDGATVYLHCEAGKNRSQIVKAAYYYMRKGEQLRLDYEVDKYGKYENALIRACCRGYLPPQREMEKFLTELGQSLREKQDLGGELDNLKHRNINNF